MLWHSLFAEHAIPDESNRHDAAPLHEAAPAHSLSGSVPAAMLPHVPFAPDPFFAVVHAWQTALHALLQHTPSTHWLLAHSPFSAHGVPFGYSAHEVAPLHVVAPAHSLSGSSPAMIVPHTPSMPAFFFAAEHAWHVDVHVVLQHTPSTQCPLAHSLFAAQNTPSA